MRNEVYDLVKQFNNLFYGDEGYRGFPIDVVEVKNGYEVIAEMPGVTKEAVKITFEDGDLTIEAEPAKAAEAKYLIHERNTMKLKRTISFGDIDEESIKAKFENGILTVTVLTKEPEVKKPKTITIE